MIENHGRRIHRDSLKKVIMILLLDMFLKSIHKVIRQVIAPRAVRPSWISFLVFLLLHSLSYSFDYCLVVVTLFPSSSLDDSK